MAGSRNSTAGEIRFAFFKGDGDLSSSGWAAEPYGLADLRTGTESSFVALAGLL